MTLSIILTTTSLTLSGALGRSRPRGPNALGCMAIDLKTNGRPTPRSAEPRGAATQPVEGWPSHKPSSNEARTCNGRRPPSGSLLEPPAV